MDNNDYFYLRELTEQIFQLREFILKRTPKNSTKYIDTVNLYNRLCKERDIIEREYGLVDG